MDQMTNNMNNLAESERLTRLGIGILIRSKVYDGVNDNGFFFTILS